MPAHESGAVSVEQMDNGYWLWRARSETDPNRFRVAVARDEVTAWRAARECFDALERMAKEALDG